MRFALTMLAALNIAACLAAEKIAVIELPDQFGKNHQITFPKDRPVLVTAADMKGADAMTPWITALKNHYRTNAIFIGIADVRSVPLPLRSFVRSKFKKKYTYPVLLDWNGAILKQLSPKASVPNIYLFSKTGEVLRHIHGPFAGEKLQELATQITRAGPPEAGR